MFPVTIFLLQFIQYKCGLMITDKPFLYLVIHISCGDDILIYHALTLLMTRHKGRAM